MNSLKSGFKRLPGPVRWSIISAAGAVTLGLVTAPFGFFWETSPLDNLGDFLVGMLILGAVLGPLEWWFHIGFKRATGLEPVWIPYPIREAIERRRERRRQRHRRGPTTAELLGGPHPHAADRDRPKR